MKHLFHFSDSDWGRFLYRKKIEGRSVNPHQYKNGETGPEAEWSSKTQNELCRALKKDTEQALNKLKESAEKKKCLYFQVERGDTLMVLAKNLDGNVNWGSDVRYDSTRIDEATVRQWNIDTHKYDTEESIKSENPKRPIIKMNKANFILPGQYVYMDGDIVVVSDEVPEGGCDVRKEAEDEEGPEEGPEAGPEEPTHCDFDEITLENLPDVLDNLSAWEDQKTDRIEVAKAIFDYNIASFAGMKFNRREGAVSLLIGDIDKGSIVPSEYLGVYKNYLEINRKEEESMGRHLESPEMLDMFEKVEALHTVARQNEHPTSEEQRKVEALLGYSVTENEFRGFWTRFRDAAWADIKHSLTLSTIATAVGSVAAGHLVVTGVGFVTFFRSTIGAKRHLEMASSRKLDIVARHAKLFREEGDSLLRLAELQRVERTGDISPAGRAEKKKIESMSNIQLLVAMDKVIRGNAGRKEKAFVDTYMKSVYENEKAASGFHAVSAFSRETVRSQIEESENIDILPELRTSIEVKRATYQDLLDEVDQEALRSTRSLTENGVFLFRIPGNLLRKMGLKEKVDTPEEAYVKVDKWLKKEYPYFLEYQDYPVPKGEQEKYRKRLRDYEEAYQLRSQLFNMLRLRTPQEGSVIFTQSMDIMDRLEEVNSEWLENAHKKGLRERWGERRSSGLSGEMGWNSVASVEAPRTGPIHREEAEIKKEIQEYLTLVGEIFEELDHVGGEGAGFMLDRVWKRRGGLRDRELSKFLQNIREKVEGINASIARGDIDSLSRWIEKIKNPKLEKKILKALQEDRPDVTRIPWWFKEDQRDPEEAEKGGENLLPCELADEKYQVFTSLDEKGGMLIGAVVVKKAYRYKSSESRNTLVRPEGTDGKNGGTFRELLPHIEEVAEENKAVREALKNVPRNSRGELLASKAFEALEKTEDPKVMGKLLKNKEFFEIAKREGWIVREVTDPGTDGLEFIEGKNLWILPFALPGRRSRFYLWNWRKVRDGGENWQHITGKRTDEK